MSPTRWASFGWGALPCHPHPSAPSSLPSMSNPAALRILTAFSAAWPLVAERLTDSGQPWSEEEIALDIAWLLDRETHPKYPRKIPSRPGLRRRWHVSDRQVRNMLRRHGRTDVEPVANRLRTDAEPARDGETPTIETDRTDGEPEANQKRTGNVHTRVDPASLSSASSSAVNEEDPLASLSSRTRGALAKSGLTTVASISVLTAHELLKRPGIGKKTLAEITTAAGIELRAPLPMSEKAKRDTPTREVTDLWAKAYGDAYPGERYPWEFGSRPPNDRDRAAQWFEGAKAVAGEHWRERLDGAIRQYLADCLKGTAWPKGDPPSTQHFTRALGKYLQRAGKRFNSAEPKGNGRGAYTGTQEHDAEAAAAALAEWDDFDDDQPPTTGAQ